MAVLSTVDPSLSNLQWTALLVIGTLAGELPDVDLVSFYFDQKKKEPEKESHRQFFTHLPIFWVGLCSAIVIAGYFLNSLFITMLGALIFSGTMSHFILDSIEHGIKWLWPLSERNFYLCDTEVVKIKSQPGTFRAHYEYITTAYVNKWSFWAEIIITAIALFVFFFSLK